MIPDRLETIISQMQVDRSNRRLEPVTEMQVWLVRFLYELYPGLYTVACHPEDGYWEGGYVEVVLDGTTMVVDVWDKGCLAWGIDGGFPHDRHADVELADPDGLRRLEEYIREGIRIGTGNKPLPEVLSCLPQDTSGMPAS